MKRRSFLKNTAIGLTGAPLLRDIPVLPGEKERRGSTVTFGLCTDTHQDIFPGVEDRLAEFIQAAKKRKVDFILQNGDFCFPSGTNGNFMSVWNSFPGLKYHVLGNHDMDRCSKDEAFDFFGAGTSQFYYSFEVKGFHFIVLDANYIYKNGRYIPYEKGNYFSNPGYINYLTPDQLDWLRKELAKTSKPVIIFSHQPLNLTVSNRGEVLKILRDANSGGVKKVIACFSGHLHKNWHVVVDDIHHVQVNSMSYLWVGDRYSCETRYPTEVQAQYPYLKNMIPYKDALYAFVELDAGRREIRITGRSSGFIPPGPHELGIAEEGIYAPSASVDSRILTY